MLTTYLLFILNEELCPQTQTHTPNALKVFLFPRTHRRGERHVAEPDGRWKLSSLKTFYLAVSWLHIIFSCKKLRHLPFSLLCDRC